ncbi:HNH endonuclease [Streptomyces sp. NPDC048361]|uniref:restriction system modified-DNA reader domain-containing protein n=1 Tax=Streptomyces sp. NPDC048361 TaxID=3154720 RepID=UPI0034439448
MKGITAPPAWTTKTQLTLDAVRAAMAANIKRVFTTHWTEDAVRNPLLDLVGEKCWFCETLIVRADITVDHFRPKSEVLEAPDHPGYWWLAYDVTNYRIACKHCNSGGARYNGVREGRAKGSQFPLLAGTRARTSLDDVEDEQPLLLDPADKDDPGLLGFDAGGYARRSNTPYSQAEADIGLCRADETIRILALNDSRLVPLRSRLIRDVSVLARYGDAPGIQQLIDERVEPQAQWSSAAAMALALRHACDQPTAVPAPPATTPGPAPGIGPARSKVDLRDLLHHLDPDDLKAGITLTGRRGKKEHHAVLTDEGQIKVLGRPWNTPNTAARAATGSNKIDGWDFWRLTIAGVEQTLAEFRARHVPPIAPM